MHDIRLLHKKFNLKECIHCMVKFTPKSLSSKGLFCSRLCANNYSIASRKKNLELVCNNCGNYFYSTPGELKFRKKILFCSIICRNKGLIQQNKHMVVICSSCGAKLDVLKSRFKNKKNCFCDNNCRLSYFKLNPQNRKKGYWYENGYRVLSISGKPIKEHIFVMQNKIGRKLHKSEVVHHINQNRSDNRIENLQLLTRAEHQALHRNYQLSGGMFDGRRKQE